MALADDVAAIREDVAYIKAKIEVIPDHEGRIRGLERWRYGIPVTGVVGVLNIIALAILGPS